MSVISCDKFWGDQSRDVDSVGSKWTKPVAVNTLAALPHYHVQHERFSAGGRKPVEWKLARLTLTRRCMVVSEMLLRYCECTTRVYACVCVQINGVDVRSRDQVLRLFGESASSVVVLFARHHVASLAPPPPSTQVRRPAAPHL